MLLNGLNREIEPVWGKKEEVRRERLRRASNLERWIAKGSPIHITSNTSLKSLSYFLSRLWNGQPPGWAVIRSYKRGTKRGCSQWWFRSDEIAPKTLERWLEKHRSHHIEFCPVTFEYKWDRVDWSLFEFGHTNRWEYPSYVEYGPIERSDQLGRDPDIVVEDKGLWLTDQQSYIDFEARDGLFVWLPGQQLSADELVELYGKGGLWRDLRFYGGDRSTVIWRIGKTCIKKGMRDPDDIKTVIRTSTAFQSRLAERGERQAERGLDNDVRKLLREAQ